MKIIADVYRRESLLRTIYLLTRVFNFPCGVLPDSTSDLQKESHSCGIGTTQSEKMLLSLWVKYNAHSPPVDLSASQRAKSDSLTTLIISRLV